jgi:hypothetical protein
MSDPRCRWRAAGRFVDTPVKDLRRRADVVGMHRGMEQDGKPMGIAKAGAMAWLHATAIGAGILIGGLETLAPRRSVRPPRPHA